MKQQLNQLLSKQVDRKDFLRHVAVGVVAISGVTAIAKTLNDFSGKGSQVSGFGAGAYGGPKK